MSKNSKISKAGVFACGRSSESPSEPDDFYPTPEWVTKLLLRREEFDGRVWEPACGDGAIARLLPVPGNVIASDLVDRGYGQGGVDFFATHLKCDHIVTNPPYKLAEKFVRHALTCATGKVAMLLQHQFQGGKGRAALFASTPLRSVYVVTKRIGWLKGGVQHNSGAVYYDWFVWEQGYEGEPNLRWL